MHPNGQQRMSTHSWILTCIYVRTSSWRIGQQRLKTANAVDSEKKRDEPHKRRKAAFQIRNLPIALLGTAMPPQVQRGELWQYMKIVACVPIGIERAKKKKRILTCIKNACNGRLCFLSTLMNLNAQLNAHKNSYKSAFKRMSTCVKMHASGRQCVSALWTLSKMLTRVYV